MDMKPTDLMIGDWYYWEAEGKKYPLQVTKETFALADEDIANFQPIPLTVEIFEKNGFKRDNCMRDRYHLGDGNGWYTIWGNILERQWWDTIHDYYDYMELETIQFVHELQHWLKVIGVEKEIIL